MINLAVYQLLLNEMPKSIQAVDHNAPFGGGTNIGPEVGIH